MTPLPVRAGADFERFFDAHYEPVVRALTLVFSRRDRAEDVAQFAFAKAYRDWRRVAEMAHPVGWVYVVALNRGRRELRDEGRHARDEETAPITRDHAAAVTTALSVQAALLTLTARQRAAVVLRYHADLALADIATAMGCSVGTVKATLHRALARLRVELTEVDDDDD